MPVPILGMTSRASASKYGRYQPPRMQMIISDNSSERFARNLQRQEIPELQGAGGNIVSIKAFFSVG